MKMKFKLNATEIKHLTMLARYMEKLPKKAAKHFNMGAWFDHNSDTHRHKFNKIITREDLTHCGTSACALGWAATMPEFRALGLMLKPDGRFVGYEGAHGDVVAKKVLGIRLTVGRHLFYDFSIGSPKQWAKVCRKYIREHK